MFKGSNRGTHPHSQCMDVSLEEMKRKSIMACLVRRNEKKREERREEEMKKEEKKK